jgi:integrase
MASVRERRPGVWEARAYMGRNPITGNKDYAHGTVYTEEPGDKKMADLKAAAWELGLIEDRRPRGKGTTFGQILQQWLEVTGDSQSPSSVREAMGIRDRYFRVLLGLDVRRIDTETLDLFYAELRRHGGQCQHRPCTVPCPQHGRRCRRTGCQRPPCPHAGRCATWKPCDRKPCDHGRPLSPATVDRAHKVIRSVLEQAVTWRKIDANPATRARSGTIEEEEIDPPAIGDVVRLLAAAEQLDPRLSVMLLVAASTGARRGAVLALRWTDLDLDAGVARFTRVIVDGPKGAVVEQKARRNKRSGSKVALDVYTVTALIALHDACFARAADAGVVLPGDALVFSDALDGSKPWRPNSVTARYCGLRDRIGLHDIRLHDLRHFMATALLNAGVNPKTIATRGGWADVAMMLNRYAHSLPAADHAAATAMGELLGRDQT